MRLVILLTASKRTHLFDFCIHEFGSNIHLGCEGFVTPQSLLKVRIGLDMMINLKRHLAGSVQTAIQKHLSRYYGQDTQRVTTSWADRKALQDIKNCPIRSYIAIDLALNMKWIVKVGDKYYPNPIILNFRLPLIIVANVIMLLLRQNFIAITKIWCKSVHMNGFIFAWCWIGCFLIWIPVLRKQWFVL